MESLFLRGKAHLIEDALTASLFDLLVVLDSPAYLAEILSGAHRVDRRGRMTGRHLELEMGWDRCAVDLWPSWREGEPDAVIWFFQGNTRTGGVVVEAKYGAGKSGEYTEGDPQLRDQLGRYASGLRRQLGPSGFLHVVYLTPHNASPTTELANSWKAIAEKTQLDPGQTLSWLPWLQVDETLRSLLDGQFRSGALEARLVHRVRALLAKSSLRSFAGWTTEIGFGRHPGALGRVFPWLAGYPRAAAGPYDGWQRDSGMYSLLLPHLDRRFHLCGAVRGSKKDRSRRWRREGFLQAPGKVTTEFPWTISTDSGV